MRCKRFEWIFEPLLRLGTDKLGSCGLFNLQLIPGHLLAKQLFQVQNKQQKEGENATSINLTFIASTKRTFF